MHCDPSVESQGESDQAVVRCCRFEQLIKSCIELCYRHNREKLLNKASKTENVSERQ